MAKFFAEVAFDWSARISSVLNRITVNDVTSSALTVSGEGEHASITVGIVHRIMWEGLVTEMSPQCYTEWKYGCLYA